MTNKVDFDDYTENYNELLREGTNFFSPNEEYFAKYKVQLVSRNADRPVNRLLEFGCGIGRNIPYLKEEFPGSLIIGSDVSEASLEIAKKNNSNIEFLVEDNRNFSEPFDLIFVAGVFHHVPVDQRHEVASILFSRLTPNGQLFVFEHNPYNPVTRKIVKDCPYDEDAVLLKPSELKQTLKESGFNIEQTKYCLFVPPKFSKLLSVERFLGWLPMGGQYWTKAKRLS